MSRITKEQLIEKIFQDDFENLKAVDQKGGDDQDFVLLLRCTTAVFSAEADSQHHHDAKQKTYKC